MTYGNLKETEVSNAEIYDSARQYQNCRAVRCQLERNARWRTQKILLDVQSKRLESVEYGANRSRKFPDKFGRSRVCVKFDRRSDGTVITQNCPVNGAKIKQKVSRKATAVFALLAGYFGGSLAFHQTSFDSSDLMRNVMPPEPFKFASQF